MKKNKMMRLASVLMVLTLLTTSVIGGTFAKYVTTAESTDSARVAKWGIKMDVDGNAMFKDSYDSSVVADNKTDAAEGDTLVAPGTNSTSIYYVTGKPETDYVISFTGTKMEADVYLKSGFEYSYVDKDDVADVSNDSLDYTAPAATTLTADYYPIVYAITVSSAVQGAVLTNGNTNGVITALNETYAFDTLDAALKDLEKVTVAYQANDDCDLTVTISWQWKFEKDSASTLGTINNSSVALTEINDALDTVLGDLKAENEDLLSSGNSNLTIEYTIQMTATQVD